MDFLLGVVLEGTGGALEALPLGKFILFLSPGSCHCYKTGVGPHHGSLNILSSATYSCQPSNFFNPHKIFH